MQFKNQFEQIVEMYCRYLELERDCSYHTVKNYRRQLLFFGNLMKIADYKGITHRNINEYRQELLKQNISNKTRNQYLIALRTFIKYLSKSFALTIDSSNVELFVSKQKEKQLNLPSMDNFKKVIAITDEQNPDMDEMFALLGFHTGLRLSELRSLKKGDVQETFTVVGKGAKERLVVCPKHTVDIVRAYENSISTELLFPQSPVYIQRALKKLAKDRAGIYLTPHGLRHMYASTLVSNGANLVDVQYLLGHSSIATTQIYAKIFDKRLVDTHKKVFA